MNFVNYVINTLDHIVKVGVVIESTKPLGLVIRESIFKTAKGE